MWLNATASQASTAAKKQAVSVPQSFAGLGGAFGDVGVGAVVGAVVGVGAVVVAVVAVVAVVGVVAVVASGGVGSFFLPPQAKQVTARRRQQSCFIDEGKRDAAEEASSGQARTTSLNFSRS